MNSSCITRFGVATGLVLSLLLPLGAAGQQTKAKGFRAGAATSNITPKLGTSINGGMQDRAATHVHDELHARCLALDDGQTKLVIVVCDSCMILREIFDQAKRLVNEATGLPVENMMMSATHTHSAPTAGAVFQSEPDPEYQDFLARRIADGVRRALNNLAPARLGWAVGSEPTEVFNRRWYLKEGTMPKNAFGKYDKVKMNPGRGSDSLVEPAGPTDPQVCVLAVQTPEGKPLALLANYSLHYVGGTGGGHISADYYGMFCDRIQQLLGADRQDPAFVGMLSNGTSGDINNINFRVKGESYPPYAKMRQVADKVATEAARVYKTIQFRDTVSLAAAQKELKLGVRKPTAEEVAQAKEIMSRAKKLPRMETLEEIYARETVQMAAYPDQVACIVQAFRIGELGIAAIPCETFVEIGLEIKERSPFRPTFTHSLANGYNGYLPTPKHHELGGYETWRAKSSYLEAQASTKITAAILEMMGKLR
ncbi:MAG: neutral/alkaline non-lysosomal ceramidase N-terminal domain-containing protein [Verrucomicrobiota bacterium]